MNEIESFLPRKHKIVCGDCGAPVGFGQPYMSMGEILVSVVCPVCGNSMSAVLEIQDDDNGQRSE